MIYFFFFFFNDTATTEIYTLSLHDALPISTSGARCSTRSGSVGEEVVHRHRPARHGWLGLGDVAAPVDGRAVRLARAIHAHDVRAEEVDVPHHQRAGREVVGALAGELALGGGSVVAFAPHLHREARRAGEKSHAELAHVERGVGRERAAMRQGPREGHVAGDRVTLPGPAGVGVETRHDLPPRITRQPARG